MATTTEAAVLGQSELIAAITLYQWLIVFFGLTQPPILGRRWSWKAWLLGSAYKLYECLLLGIAIRTTYYYNDVVAIFIVELKFDSISGLLAYSFTVTICLLQFIMLFISVFWNRRLVAILISIAELEAEINDRTWCAANLNFFKRRFGVRWRLASRSGVLFIFLLVVFPRLHLFLTPDTTQLVFTQRVLSVLPIFIIEIKCVEYCVYVQVVHELFWRLQEDLKQLRREIIRSQTMATDIRNLLSLQLSATLQRNQQLVARVWTIVNSLEGYFSPPLLLLMVFNGISVTNTANWGYSNFLKGINTYSIYRIIYAGLIFINTIFPALVTQSCINTYNKFGVILHSMKSSSLNVSLMMRLKEYSLQLMHQKLVFSCGGFFDINMGLFGRFVLTVFTYVVILIQFKMQRHAENMSD